MNDILGQLDDIKGELDDMKGRGNFWREPPSTGTAGCLNTTEPPWPKAYLGPWSNISVREISQIIFFLGRKDF